MTPSRNSRIRPEAGIAWFLYERGRTELKTGRPWDALTTGERDTCCDFVRPLMAPLERCIEEMRRLLQEAGNPTESE